MNRRTVARELSWSGVGVHTGENCQVTVRPFDRGLAIRNGSDLVALTPQLARDTFRCTGLRLGERQLLTVEHLLSALNGMGVTDAEIDVDGPELPVLDGSALPFAQAIRKGGLAPIPEREAAPMRQVALQDGASSIAVAAGEGTLNVVVEFPHPAIGRQEVALGLTPERYLSEIAPARTFGFLEDAEALRAAGFARGASLENTVVFSKEGPMTPLRFDDEPVRHKALDLIGDLALSGHSIYELAVAAVRPGHSINVSAAKRLCGGGVA